MGDLETGDRARFLATVRHRLASAQAPSGLRPVAPAPATPPEPTYLLLEDGDRIAGFTRAAEAVDATVALIRDERDLRAAVMAIVATHQPATVSIVPSPETDRIASELQHLGIPRDDEDLIHADLAVTTGHWGIAATGSVVHIANERSPRSIITLPRVHVVALRAERILRTPSDLFRRQLAAADLPSALVLITGPSRTGDIEQVLTLGVHGPTALHILVFADPNPEPEGAQ